MTKVLRLWLAAPLLLALIASYFYAAASRSAVNIASPSQTITARDVEAIPTGRDMAEIMRQTPGVTVPSAIKVDIVLFPLHESHGRLAKDLTQDINAASGRDAKLEVIREAKTKLTEAVTAVGEYASPQLVENTQKAQKALTELETYFNSSAYDPSMDPTGKTVDLRVSGDFSRTNFYTQDFSNYATNVRPQIGFEIKDALANQYSVDGGFSAEYGRFQGGTINVITKRGANDFGGSLRVNLEYFEDSPSSGSTTQPASGGRFDSVDFGLGGPIIKDRLWYFNNFAGVRSDDYEVAIENKSNRFDYEIGFEGHSFYLGAWQASIHNPSDFDGFDSGPISQRDGSNGASQGAGSATSNYSDVYIRTYGGTSLIRDDFADYDAVDRWSMGVIPAETTPPKSDLEYLFNTSWGDHALKFGSVAGESSFSGPYDGLSIGDPQIYGAYSGIGGLSSLEGFVQPEVLASPSGSIRGGGSFYINDRWQLNDKWSFNMGVRFDESPIVEEGSNNYADMDNFQPRLGFSYDVRGDGDLRTTYSYSDYTSRYTESATTDAKSEALQAIFDWYFQEGATGVIDPVAGGNTLPIFEGQSINLVPGDRIVFNNGPFTTSEYFGGTVGNQGFYNSGVSLNFEYIAGCQDVLRDADVENFFAGFSGRAQHTFTASYPIGSGFCGGRIGFSAYRENFDYLVDNDPRFRRALGGYHEGTTLNTLGFQGQLLEPLVNFLPTVPTRVASSVPNDTYYHAAGSAAPDLDDQWGLKRIGIKAVPIQEYKKGSDSLWPARATPTVVAVVDSGIDITHPELQGQLWANFDEIPNNGKDDDKNGLVDDVLGWNFSDWNNNIYDQYGHGTFIAGIIGAATNNGMGIAGINPWARIMPVKVSGYTGRSNNARIAQGIYYAANMGARVINVSFEGDIASKAIQKAVDYAVSKDALVVVASGNRGLDVAEISPAGLSGVLTVAAIGQEGERAAYSNWGKQVDIAAAGTHIVSLRADKTDLMQFENREYKRGANIVDKGGLLYHLSGTSFAAPHVAGVASLLFSINPQLSAEQVKRMILQSAKDIDAPGTDFATGYGELDAAAALKADPDYYIDALIESAQVTSGAEGVVLSVAGSAGASKFDNAWLELGQGDTPKRWRKVGTRLKKPVQQDVLFEVSPSVFQGSQVWTLRLVVQHKDGSRRISQLPLKLG